MVNVLRRRVKQGRGIGNVGEDYNLRRADRKSISERLTFE